MTLSFVTTIPLPLLLFSFGYVLSTNNLQDKIIRAKGPSINHRATNGGIRKKYNKGAEVFMNKTCYKPNKVSFHEMLQLQHASLPKVTSLGK